MNPTALRKPQRGFLSEKQMIRAKNRIVFVSFLLFERTMRMYECFQSQQISGLETASIWCYPYASGAPTYRSIWKSQTQILKILNKYKTTPRLTRLLTHSVRDFYSDFMLFRLEITKDEKKQTLNHYTNIRTITFWKFINFACHMM